MFGGAGYVAAIVRGDLRDRKDGKSLGFRFFVLLGILFLVVNLAFGTEIDPGSGVPVMDAVGGVGLIQNISMAPADAAAVGRQIGAALDTALQGLATNSSILDTGHQILYFIIAISTLWILIKTLATGQALNQFFGDWIPQLITCAIALVMMDRAIGASISSTFDSIAAAVAGGGLGNIKDTVGTTVGMGLKAISSIMSLPSRSTSLFDIASWWTLLPALLLMIVVKGFSMLLVLMALGGFIMNLLLSYASITLALALAPLFIPFLAFKPAEFLFDGWLRFLLGAAMMKVVGAFFLVVASSLLSAMVAEAKNLDMASQTVTSGTSSVTGLVTDVVVYGAVVLLAASAWLVMQSVPQIAHGLISGSARGSGFGGWGSLANSAGMKAMNHIKFGKGGSMGSVDAALGGGAPMTARSSLGQAGSSAMGAIGAVAGGTPVGAAAKGLFNAAMFPTSMAVAAFKGAGAGLGSSYGGNAAPESWRSGQRAAYMVARAAGSAVTGSLDSMAAVDKSANTVAPSSVAGPYSDLAAQRAGTKAGSEKRK